MYDRLPSDIHELSPNAQPSSSLYKPIPYKERLNAPRRAASLSPRPLTPGSRVSPPVTGALFGDTIQYWDGESPAQYSMNADVMLGTAYRAGKSVQPNEYSLYDDVPFVDAPPMNGVYSASHARMDSRHMELPGEYAVPDGYTERVAPVNAPPVQGRWYPGCDGSQPGDRRPVAYPAYANPSEPLPYTDSYVPVRDAGLAAGAQYDGYACYNGGAVYYDAPPQGAGNAADVYGQADARADYGSAYAPDQTEDWNNAADEYGGDANFLPEDAPQPVDDATVETTPSHTNAKARQSAFRFWRFLAKLTAVATMLFCVFVIANSITKTQAYDDAVRRYEEQRAAGDSAAHPVTVQLLREGQTYEPTATPAPRAAASSAAPSVGVQDADAASLLRTVPDQYKNNRMKDILPAMADIHSTYPNVVGRIIINGVLDAYIAQKDNFYYITHDYTGKKNNRGSVFVDANCSLKKPPENMMLRGNSAAQDDPFWPLWRYQSEGKPFVRNALKAKLMTIYEEVDCTLFAVVSASADINSDSYFPYMAYLSFTNDGEMMRYVDNAKSRSLYQINVDVKPGDRLLTLATMSNAEGLALALLFKLEQ